MNLAALTEHLAGVVETDVAEHVGTLEDARAYVAAFLAECQKKPKLVECSLKSLEDSLLVSAALGLPVDSSEGVAYLSVEAGVDGALPEAVFIPGYPAFVEILHRDCGVDQVEAQVVFERDEFEFELGVGRAWTIPGALAKHLNRAARFVGYSPGFRHVKWWRSDPGPAVAVYACLHFANGLTKREVMLRRDWEGVSRPDAAGWDAGSHDKWGTRDGLEWLKGLAVKRASKLLVPTASLRALIYLARGAERSRVRPSSKNALKILGVERARGGIALLPPDKEFSEKIGATGGYRCYRANANGEAESIGSVKVRCCSCGNDDKPTKRAQVFKLRGHLSECGTAPSERSYHDLCEACRADHARALAFPFQPNNESTAPAVGSGPVSGSDGPKAGDTPAGSPSGTSAEGPLTPTPSGVVPGGSAAAAQVQEHESAAGASEVFSEAAHTPEVPIEDLEKVERQILDPTPTLVNVTPKARRKRPASKVAEAPAPEPIGEVEPKWGATS